MHDERNGEAVVAAADTVAVASAADGTVAAASAHRHVRELPIPPLRPLMLSSVSTLLLLFVRKIKSSIIVVVVHI